MAARVANLSVPRHTGPGDRAGHQMYAMGETTVKSVTAVREKGTPSSEVPLILTIGTSDGFAQKYAGDVINVPIAPNLTA